MMNQLPFPTPEYKELPLDMVGGNTFGRWPKISPAETFNMFQVDDALMSFAGYEVAAIIAPSGVARQLYNSSRFNHLISVIDDGVYIIGTALNVERVGTLDTFSGAVYIAENFASQIAIVDGLNIYLFNYANDTFIKVDVDFLPVYISFQDTYFIAADGRTNQWRLSGNNDGTMWPADAFHVGAFESKVTNTVATVPLNNQLFVFGKTGAEPWYDSGAQLFPYQRNEFYVMDYGCESAETIAVDESLMVWLASNEKSGPAIMYSQGGQPQTLSTDGINYRLSQIKNPQSSFGFLYKLEGHVIYQLTFTDPEDNVSYMYDFNTKKFFTLTDENMDHHIAKRIAFFNDAYYFISFKDGNLYKVGSEFTTYNGFDIPRVRVHSNLRLPNSRRFFCRMATLTIESGEDSTYQKVNLSISSDGGYTYSHIGSEEVRPLGRRRNMLQFWNLPNANDMVFQWRFHGQDRFIITSGEVIIYQ